jgi:hypothetical protein
MFRFFSLFGLLLLLAIPAGAQGNTWRVPIDFPTIQAAIDSVLVSNGDTILLEPGSYAGALVSKAVTIKGEGGATISSGPAHPSGLIQGFRLMAGSGGSTFSHLNFTVDLAIMNGAAADDVTVTHSTFHSSVQAISNWRGSRWNITHNEILDLRTRCGGGIGILIGDYAGGAVNDNVVAHNKISGTLHVSANDCGGYSGTGIVLYADFRWGAAGATDMAWNRVVKNHVSLVSDTPAVVDVVAFELTDTRNDSSLTAVILNNAIGFNDFRGTLLQVAVTPTSLDTANTISRNLGENRGHGLHPSLFGPDGN